MSKESYLSLIEFAKRALRKGDRAKARKLAQYIVSQYPEGLEGLLILGGLVKPQESLVYLNKAYEIAPDDPRVKEALAWARARVKAAAFTPDQEKTAEIRVAPLSPQPTVEKRGLVWVWALMIILTLSLIFLIMGIIPRNPNEVSSNFSLSQATKLNKTTLTATQALPTDPATDLATSTEEISFTSTNTEIAYISPTPSPTPTPTNTPTPTATPTIIPDLYGTYMELRFTSGPLEDYGTTFTMVERQYFYDKGDLFDVGKNTGVFYEDLRYLILHSGYEDSTLTNALEAEFLRKYLESWGNSGNDYIESQMETLKGSKMIWISDYQKAIEVELVDVIRLSHEASSELWLEPENLLQIIEDREGNASEWIGEMNQSDTPSVYLAFCGWGPSSVTEDRSIYYRYVIRFEILT